MGVSGGGCGFGVVTLIFISKKRPRGKDKKCFRDSDFVLILIFFLD